ncbi:MAG: transposase [Treponema sp.]|nr:transposase [Treponema sp.]
MNAKNCPKCGKYFASVRCPSCGFSGEEGLFRDGCPVCGYSASQDVNAVSWPEEARSPAGSLPVWVYITAVLALAAVLGALAFHLMR